ncbi:MAG: hypothetical protein IGS50_10765 [Synechococcales cyanobacterium C42_A2020_086]|jgi:hypothetical protein|nr:hypothetical protein [Synechococcales cyanobacterium C42_A2020_086]
MSIEQTSQLIQLILNSLLLLMVSALVLAGLSLRLQVGLYQLQTAHQDYVTLASEASEGEFARGDYLTSAKLRLQSLRTYYRLTHSAVLASHYVLLLSGGSTLVLAARTLVNADWLINVALGLFVSGSGLLLLSVGLALLALWHSSDRLKTENGMFLGNEPTGQPRVWMQRREGSCLPRSRSSHSKQPRSNYRAIKAKNRLDPS